MDTWVKVVFPFPPGNESLDSWLVALAEKRDKELGDPPGFAVFDRLESDERSLVYYFSPVAASACAGMLATFLPETCDKPDPAIPGLGIVYGDLVGMSSWDLLK